MGNVEGAAQAIADALAPTQQSPSARWRWGTVASVQDDGTITAAVGGATVSGIRASQQAMGAAAGDRVRICYLGTEAFADSLRASSKLIKLPSIEADSLALGSPLTIANGGTGATTAEGARSNLLAVCYQSGINAQVSNFIGATQLFGLNASCINANNALNGKRVSLIVRNDGLSGWNISDSSQLWSMQLPTSSISFNNAFTSTVAQVITAASGFTISQASYVQNGRMGQWYMTVKTTNAMSANTQYTIGTVVSGKRPATWSPVTFGETTNAYGNGRMVAGGSVLVRPSASIAAGSTFYLLCPAYILG